MKNLIDFINESKDETYFEIPKYAPNKCSSKVTNNNEYVNIYKMFKLDGQKMTDLYRDFVNDINNKYNKVYDIDLYGTGGAFHAPGWNSLSRNELVNSEKLIWIPFTHDGPKFLCISPELKKMEVYRISFEEKEFNDMLLKSKSFKKYFTNAKFVCSINDDISYDDDIETIINGLSYFTQKKVC